MKPRHFASYVIFSFVFALLISSQGCFTIERSVTRNMERSSPPDPELYNRILGIWENGDQIRAESLAKKALERNPEDQKLLFFYAVCLRSRFDKEGSLPFMDDVRKMDTMTPEGQCAACIFDLDQNLAPEQNLKLLSSIVKAHPNDPILLWMMAVQCRSYDMDDEGIRDYRKLLKMVGKGSSLVHTTYANLLADIGRHKEALTQYAIALKEEPASWSLRNYQIDLNAIQEDKNTQGDNQNVKQLMQSITRRKGDKVYVCIRGKTNAQLIKLWNDCENLCLYLTKNVYPEGIPPHCPELMSFYEKRHITSAQYSVIEDYATAERWDLSPKYRVAMKLKPLPPNQVRDLGEWYKLDFAKTL